MKCQEQAGFLIPRPCRNEATVQCSACSKSVCGDHTTGLTHGGLACTSCAAGQNVGPGVQRRQLFDYYGYRPGFYGYGHGVGLSGGYTPADYAAFDAQDATPGQDLQETIDGS